LSVGEFDDAMQAPFPDKGYKAGVREFSRLLLELKKKKTQIFKIINDILMFWFDVCCFCCADAL
jgi:hypothetical protein